MINAVYSVVHKDFTWFLGSKRLQQYLGFRRTQTLNLYRRKDRIRYFHLPKATIYPSKLSLLIRFQVPLKSTGIVRLEKEDAA